MSGDVELVLQWRYNARLDFCPFDDFVDEHVGEAPNELRIALIRAQGLAIADKNLLSKGGSSDPRCTFELTGPPSHCLRGTFEDAGDIGMGL